MPDDAQRLITLEEKLAYLEQHLGELDGVVRELAGRLEQQHKGVQQVRSILEQHLAGGDEGGAASDDPAADRPPHW